jgi:hypothetical protein
MDGTPLDLDGETLPLDVGRHGFRLVAVGNGSVLPREYYPAD